jgi:acetyl-CoA carboxylase carboxyltransferase component
MGGEQAANVLTTIREDQLQAKGMELSEAQKDEIRRPIIEKYEKEGAAYYSTSRLWDDGIIAPADTRKILGLAISVSLNAKFKAPRSGVYRM